MPSYNLRRFAHPGVLQSVSPQVLLEFLRPHADFIASKGFDLPQSDGVISDFDYLALTSILMKPDEHMPNVLMDALFYTHEMATDRTMDKLLAVAQRLGLLIPSESTPMDVAMRIWIRDPLALEKAHSEHHIYRSRAFEHFQADAPLPFPKSDGSRLAEMEAALDVWFEERKRGGNTRVFIYPGDEEVWFLIRHGDAYRRESAVEGYKSKGLFYRPEAFDVACYVPLTGELRIHAKSKITRDLYKREIGLLIAGDPSHFPGDGKYTLNPLMEEGQRALYCKDAPGIDSIILTSLRVKRRALLARSYQVDYSAQNVFLVFMGSEERLGEHDTLERAKFTVKFSDSEKPRSVTLSPPNKVQVCRDSDTALVETWLRKRGFVVGVMAEHEETDGVLASL